jgi:hypothetical protein
MSLSKHIENVYTVYKPKRGWNTIYWLVDVHGVIMPGSWHKQNEFRFINQDCISVLRWIAERPDQKLILWTSSHTTEATQIIEWLARNGISIDYFNHNPDEKNTSYADFTDKFYFNILLDDKSGFDPQTDWNMIRETLQRINVWQSI